MNSAQSYQIGVVGDGPVAHAMVLAAVQLGLKTAHIRSADLAKSSTKPDLHAPIMVPRAYAIAPAVQAFLAKTGVWGLLHSHQKQTTQTMAIRWESNQASAPWVLEAKTAGIDQLCTFVAESDLAQAFHTALTVHQANFTAIQAAISHIQIQAGHSALLQLEHGQTLSCELLIVADGAQSRVRALLDLEPTVYDYRHQAVVAIVQAARPHCGAASQWLMADGSVLAMLPLPSGVPGKQDTSDRYGLVWSQPSPQAQAYLQNTQQLTLDLNARCAESLGALSLISPCASFPLSQATPALAPKAHVILLGDAAHRIHPLAGQGLNLGFEDVFVLAQVLSQRDWRGCGDPRLVARFHRQRAAPLGLMMRTVHLLARRGDWPASLNHAGVLGLDFLNQWPRMGAWFARKMVQHAVKAPL